MNLFTELSRPLTSRPGDPTPRRQRQERPVSGKPRKGRRFEPQPTPWGLTGMECEVARLLVKHGSSESAARELCISPKTLTTYCTRIKEKMRLESTLHMAIAWDRFARRVPGQQEDDAPQRALAGTLDAVAATMDLGIHGKFAGLLRVV